ncbi:MAG: malate/lactate/ureidoglycolate dehydrogenase [Alphaproteobacteria bacterium]
MLNRSVDCLDNRFSPTKKHKGEAMIATAQRLANVIQAIFLAADSNQDEASAIAENLIEANLTGHDSHGIGMVPRYVERVLRGAINVNQHATVTHQSGPVVQVDGNLGYGQVIGAETLDIGIEKTRETGATIIALRNSHHLGRIGAWGEKCADAGFVSIHFVNAIGLSPQVAPYGGVEGRYSTNPYCTSIPSTSEQPRIVLDMATSKVAMGKVLVARNRGEKIADGVLLDPEGFPTNNPDVMFGNPRGALVPFGDHKGYGLSFICEVLAGALINGGTCVPRNQVQNTAINNMLSIILDPNALGDSAVFRKELDEITAYVKSARPAEGVDEVMVPGDPERAAKAKRQESGISVDDETWRQVLGAANSVGLRSSDIDQLIAA